MTTWGFVPKEDISVSNLLLSVRFQSDVRYYVSSFKVRNVGLYINLCKSQNLKQILFGNVFQVLVTTQNNLINFGSHYIYYKNWFGHIRLPLNENLLLVERLKFSNFQPVCIRCFSLLYLLTNTVYTIWQLNDCFIKR